MKAVSFHGSESPAGGAQSGARAQFAGRRAVIGALALALAAAGADARTREPDPAGAPGAAAGGAAGAPSVEEAIALITAFNSKYDKSRYEQIVGVIEGAEGTHGSLPAWRLGKALVLRGQGKKTEARDMLAALVKAAPGVADHQFWYGSLCFETIESAGFFEKMSLADKGKGALEQAIKLDADHLWARFGLFQFYANAPGIAGGSTSKARALANEMLAIKDGRGEFQGHVLLGQLAAKDDDWAQAQKQYDLAGTSRGDGSGRAAALRAHARALLNIKKDPGAALAKIDEAVPLADKDDAGVWFVKAQCHQQLKQFAPAAEAYARALEVSPQGAPNSLFGLAECREALGQKAEAARHYGEFADKYPGDERAEKAREGAKRCTKR